MFGLDFPIQKMKVYGSGHQVKRLLLLVGDQGSPRQYIQYQMMCPMN